MNYNVIAVDKFRKEAKRLVKKYPSLVEELRELAEILKITLDKGTLLGGNLYKIRIAIKSKGKRASRKNLLLNIFHYPASSNFDPVDAE